MSGLKKCILYIVVSGIVGFIAGRLFPRDRFRYDEPPFRELPFENGGHFYRRLKIHRWHKLLPDMSRILPGLMPPKRVTRHISAAQAEVMVQETCIAEVIHVSLGLCGLAIPFLWPGAGGVVACLLYILLGNLPFILIQRFNRPKLRMLLEKCRRAEQRAQLREAAE